MVVVERRQVAPHPVAAHLDHPGAELEPEDEPAQEEDHDDRRRDLVGAEERDDEARLEQQALPAERVEGLPDRHDREVEAPEQQEGEHRHPRRAELRKAGDEQGRDQHADRADQAQHPVRVVQAEDRGLGSAVAGAQELRGGQQAALAEERRELAEAGQERDEEDRSRAALQHLPREFVAGGVEPLHVSTLGLSVPVDNRSCAGIRETGCVMHIRVIAPHETAEDAAAVVRADLTASNVVLLPGVALDGTGDLLMFDVTRENANAVIRDLEALDIVRMGSITITEGSTVLSDASERAEAAAPGSPADGVVWAGIEDRATKDSRLSWSFLAFLILATLIAGIGRYLDQPILIIGAMVVGPEFAPIAAICVGIARWRPRLIAPAAATLLGGFALAIGVAFVLWFLAYSLGLIDYELATTGDATDFIVKPDIWSFIVALLAGCAGILSLTTSKSSALVGVFISITTVPAVATIALTLAVAAWDEALASTVQLGINLLGLLVAGVVTLLIQSMWSRSRKGVRR